MAIDLASVLSTISKVGSTAPAFVELIGIVSREFRDTDQNQIKQALDEAMKRSDSLHATAQAELRKAE